jgi:hypothetical protein
MPDLSRIFNGKTSSAGILVIAIVLVLNTVMPFVEAEPADIDCTELKMAMRLDYELDKSILTALKEVASELNGMSKTQERIVLIQERVLREAEKMERFRRKGG